MTLHEIDVVGDYLETQNHEENRRKAAMFDLIVSNKLSMDWWTDSLSIGFTERSGKVRYLTCKTIREGLMKALSEGHIR